MGIFEYECPQGHSTEKMRPVSKRHEPVTCETCQEPAIRILSPTATTFRAMDRKAFKRRRG